MFMSWLQELIGDLHKEFLAEYVRKMMKNKIRFADKEKQEKAAEAVCKNSNSIHTRLTAAVSAHYSDTQTYTRIPIRLIYLIVIYRVQTWIG